MNAFAGAQSALAEGVAQRRKAAEKLRQLDLEAQQFGLKGQKKHEFLCAGLGWDARTSTKRITRLRAEFNSRSSAVRRDIFVEWKANQILAP